MPTDQRTRVFLKSLTLRGFKSFADKTRLDFEPGVTVVVGPNGSGKSNIVDALTWVLGSHSPKSLRGGSMSDVIFAGAPGKSALGRASVEITIDNMAGTLPIEFSEVTVARSMFASGENDYSINGVECRLLDVAELLSDTGLGRESHTIVGQGRLDAILNAKPEERRAFIEEAAGILKHRRRKERSLRKLAQMDAHLERLTDILRELRRNLRPLERQAEAAAKHADLQRELRGVRVTRALRELAALTDRWDADTRAQTDSEARATALRGALEGVRGAEAAVEHRLAELVPLAREAGQTHFRLANLTERFRGLTARIEERRRGLVEATEEPLAGRDPDHLRAEARQERSTLSAIEEELVTARSGLAEAEECRREAERSRRAHEQAAAAEARRRAEARERQLRWEGEVAALRSSLAQAAGEDGRLASQLSGLESRARELEADASATQAEIQRLDADGAGLTEQLAGAETRLTRCGDAADDAAGRERDLERQRASLEARADALRAASEEAGEGAAALLRAAKDGEVSGVLGPLADHVEVVEGMATAAAAALGNLGDAIVVRSRDAAEDAVGFVRSQRTGRVLLLAGTDTDPAPPAERDRQLADLGARPLVEALCAEPGIQAALGNALSGHYAVHDYATACELARRWPHCTFVSSRGEIAGARGYAGGVSVSPSGVLSRAAAEQAERQLEAVNDELLVAHRQVADGERERVAARLAVDAAAAAMQESDGQITAAAERLKRLRNEQATCRRELELVQQQSADLSQEIAAQRERLAALEERGVEEVPPAAEGADLEAERLDDALADARESEVQARLGVSAAAQRHAEVQRRVQVLESEAEDVERRLAEREERRRRRLAGIARCTELAEVAAKGLSRTEASLELAATERDRVEEDRAAQERELGALRSRLRELEKEMADVTEERHREELARQELRLAIEGVRARLRDELALDPDTALAEARAEEAGAAGADGGRGRDGRGGAAGADGGGGPEGEETDALFGGGKEREAQLAEQEDRLVRKIGLLGTINPLALEEFTAMEERHRFLSDQLDDLRASRRDLIEVVEAVDARIREVFTAAFADVAAQFERIFPRLFPGGEGRLVLTDHDDLLEAGIEVEARPAGKRVKRLSLLSGGERSLTALAVLFAIFAARPSPFYVLDEVEAALDDVNLQRFLDVVADFRATSQLIIVTHQKRTMEVADLLYGVSMRGDGVSKVVSQRMEEPAVAGG